MAEKYVLGARAKAKEREKRDGDVRAAMESAKIRENRAAESFVMGAPGNVGAATASAMPTESWDGGVTGAERSGKSASASF